MPAAVSKLQVFMAQPGFIRRFCACGTLNDCVCGHPRAASGWTVAGLTEVAILMREHHSSLTISVLTGRSLQEVNQALNSLIARTPAHALAAMEALLQRPTRTARPPETCGEPAAILRNGRWCSA